MYKKQFVILDSVLQLKYEIIYLSWVSASYFISFFFFFTVQYIVDVYGKTTFQMADCMLSGIHCIYIDILSTDGYSDCP